MFAGHTAKMARDAYMLASGQWSAGRAFGNAIRDNTHMTNEDAHGWRLPLDAGAEFGFSNDPYYLGDTSRTGAAGKRAMQRADEAEALARGDEMVVYTDPGTKRGRKRKRVRSVPGAEFVDYGSVGTGMISLRFFDSVKTSVQIHAPLAGVWTSCEVDPDGGCLFHPSLGSGESQRLGRVAYMKSIHIMGIISRPAQVVGATETIPDGAVVFLALVRDKQTNGVQLNSEDVYINAGTTVTEASNPLRNLNNENRFDIVRTLRVPLTVDGGFSTIEPATDHRRYSVGRDVPFDWYVRITDEVRFQSDTGSVDDITDESYHMIACVNSTHMVYRLSFSCRSRYTC